jgi:ankyrin repeat protein
VKSLQLTGLVAAAAFTAISLAAAAGDTRLTDAAQRRDDRALRTLVTQRVDVNARQNDGTTALAWAAHWDDAATVDLLIAAGADVNLANDEGVTPLALAAVNGGSTVAEKLLNAGADPNRARSTGETPLMTASYTGSLEVVRRLIAHGAAVNANSIESKQTPLMWAVSEKHPEVVRLLVSAGADVHARSAGGFTPLLFAARQGDVESAKILLDAGADVEESARDRNTALSVATASGREDVALLLLDRGADANASGAGYTAIHTAVPKDLRRLVQSLLAHGADPNRRLTSAPPSLFGPSRGAGSEVSSDVAPATPPPPPADGAQPDVPARGRGGMSAGSLSGATAFWLAAKNVNVEMMQILLDGGADPSLTPVDGTTPLMVASGLTQVQGPRARRGDVSSFYSNWGEDDSLRAVQFLVHHGAAINAVNQAHQTALHGAAYMGANSVVTFLIDHGATLNAQDRQGQTPFRIAEGHLNVAGQGVTDWPKTAALLRQLGADVSLGVDGRTMLRRYVKTSDSTTSAPALPPAAPR